MNYIDNPDYRRVEVDIESEVQRIISNPGLEVIKAGNTGFRIVGVGIGTKRYWEWHFTPDSTEDSPVDSDYSTRARYVRMFYYGFYSILLWKIGNPAVIGDTAEITTNRKMKDFLVRALGKEFLYIEDLEESGFFVQINLKLILEDKNLLKRLEDNYNFVFKHTFKVIIYEKI